MDNNNNSQLSTLNSQLSSDSQLKQNVVKTKSFDFALRMIKLSKYLQNEKREFVISKQVLRSGTSVGALVRESEHAQSKADFIHKMSIALKEANETDYWIELLHKSEEITDEAYNSLQPQIQELIKLLVKIVKTSKERNVKHVK
ncbi:MAG: four helix bundle protein [Spirochaetales bacterium]